MNSFAFDEADDGRRVVAVKWLTAEEERFAFEDGGETWSLQWASGGIAAAGEPATPGSTPHSPCPPADS